MGGRVSRRRHNQHVTRRRDRDVFGKRTDRLWVHLEPGRGEPRRPMLGGVAVDLSTKAHGPLILFPHHQDSALWKVAQSTRMVGMEMGHHHRADVSRVDPNLSQLWADFVFGADVQSEGESGQRVPAGEGAWVERLSRVARL